MHENNIDWAVNYESEIITGNSVIKPKGCNCLSIEGIDIVSVQVAIIDYNIPLTYGQVRMFNNRPGEVITKELEVTFPNSGTVNRVLVVRTFYTKK